jgi:translation initiation factor 4B
MTPPASASSVPSSPRNSVSSAPLRKPSNASNVRPSFSFANAAGAKKDNAEKTVNETDNDVDSVTEKVAEVTV